MELGWDLRLWEGAVKEERFLHPRSPFTSWEISQDRKEVSEAQKRVHQPACSREDTERPEERVLATSMTPQLERGLGIGLQAMQEKKALISRCGNNGKSDRLYFFGL